MTLPSLDIWLIVAACSSIALAGGWIGGFAYGWWVRGRMEAKPCECVL